jgi:tripartite-type tricarboxylate transporter receptor subunit TctC
MRSTRRTIAKLAALSLVAPKLLIGPSARAQAWPNKPIKMIVPFAAGGGTDFIARLVAQHLTTRLGQPIYVDNRGGANGAIGLQALKQSDPDGYTIAATPNTPLVVNPHLHANLRYKPLEDFIPVAPMVRFPSLILAHPSARISTVPELIAAAKAAPGNLAYGSSGTGGFSHLAMELFSLHAGIKLLHVPYKGAGPAAAAQLSGEVPLGYNNVQVTLQNIRAGQLVPLGIGLQERVPTLPDVPTIFETLPELPAFGMTSWAGIITPASTPKAIVERLNTEVTAVMASPEVAKHLDSQQLTPFSSEQAAFANIVKTELEKWSEFIKEKNITIEGKH